MKKLILIKYGELTTKKDNRKMFIRLLENNIKNLLKDINFSLHCDRVRMYIEVDEIDLDNTVSRLKNVFGIHSIVVCHQVNTNNDDIKNKVLELVKCYPQAKTFKIELAICSYEKREDIKSYIQTYEEVFYIIV